MSPFSKSEKSDEEQVALLFWALNGEKHGEKNEFEANHSFKELITISLRATRSRHSFLRDSILSRRSLQKEQLERITPVALFGLVQEITYFSCLEFVHPQAKLS